MDKVPETGWSHPAENLDVQPHQVDVWRIFLDLPSEAIKVLENSLSHSESQRAARFHFQRDRNRYIVAHASLRDILGRYLGVKTGQLAFTTNAYGKPVLVNHNIAFNLSHSSSYALIAVAEDRKVGVDIECVRPDIEYENVARRSFSQREMAEFRSLPIDQKVLAFFLCWTRKEAYIKARGLGLSIPLDSFDVSLTPGKPAKLRYAEMHPDDAAGWTLKSLDISPDYAAALVIEDRMLMDPGSVNATEEVRCWDWQPSQAGFQRK